MQLSECVYEPYTEYSGSCELSMVVAEDLKIEGNGQEILDIECPSGKEWKVAINVSIVETDV